MSEPFLSVIMGVYNCPTEEMLMRAINSVLDQSFSDFEFIICDDGSDNDTYKWLEKAAAGDSRIILIRNKRNMSLAYSLNRCIEISRGQFIARQDADDYSLPERFAVQLDYLKTHNEMSFVGSDCLLFDDDNNICGSRKMPHHPKKLDFLFNSPFVHGSVMLRRDVFDHAGVYRPCGYAHKYEDYDLFMRIYHHELRGANINTPLYAFFDNNKRRVPRIMRVDEAAVRYNGFKALGLLPVGYIYVLKPFALALLPSVVVNSLKKAWVNAHGH
ncbi:MAG: glycosyltransferase [Oscillospiraceae bacterium]|nr:glycosyltransferase [Oscillospiraceae bacterium]